MKTAVVIPNWNGADVIRECLRSLQAQTQPATIIVVDNGSEDGSVDLIEKHFPKVVTLKQSQNLGFSGGVNAGIHYALENGAEEIALLNNDAVADPAWLAHLIKTLHANKNIGIVASKILLADKKHLDSTGEIFTWWGISFPRGRNEVDDGQYDSQTDIFAASGGASLYRADLFRQIGTFDEDFFAYLEDIDVSFRARAAGWRVIFEPKARAYHKLSVTSKKLGKDFAFFHFVKNFALLYDRNMPAALYWKYLPFFALQFLRLFLSSLVRGRPHIFFRSVWAVFALSAKTLAIRKQRRVLRTVTVRELDKLIYKGWAPRPHEVEADHG